MWSRRSRSLSRTADFKVICDLARQIGTLEVEKQPVACLNTLSACDSIFRWEGKICQGREIPAILRTSEAKMTEL
ncbi:MAG TPA: hypothetical protein DDW68_13435 [Verrucomicrobiales bacterium]|nr:hypothetical protein [Verrucomicrobiales bacterium]HBE98164.1 hypothetical protein [Verrucomicrobiales bacterium]